MVRLCIFGFAIPHHSSVSVTCKICANHPIYVRLRTLDGDREAFLLCVIFFPPLLLFVVDEFPILFFVGVPLSRIEDALPLLLEPVLLLLLEPGLLLLLEAGLLPLRDPILLLLDDCRDRPRLLLSLLSFFWSVSTMYFGAWIE